MRAMKRTRWKKTVRRLGVEQALGRLGVAARVFGAVCRGTRGQYIFKELFTAPESSPILLLAGARRSEMKC